MMDAIIRRRVHPKGKKSLAFYTHLHVWAELSSVKLLPLFHFSATEACK